MRCPLCAEEIRDEAVVCRFCGASFGDGVWTAGHAPTAPRGLFTLRFAGVLFCLSALFEIASTRAAVPLFGELRGGIIAIAYHVFFTVLFLAVGFGLFFRQRWTCPAVGIATLVYTLDRVAFIVDTKARHIYVSEFLKPYRDLVELVDEASIQHFFVIAVGLLVAGWWAFALYVYLRRGVFNRRDPTPEAAD